MLEEAVIDQVETAVDNVSPETADLSTATHDERPTGPTRGERVSKLYGKAKEHYQRTGDVSAAEALMGTAKAETSLPGADAQTEVESGPTGREQQPRTSRNDHNFKKVTDKLSATERELIAAKAKLEVFERQSTGSGKAVPATESTREMPEVSDDPRPEFPDIEAFDDPKKYTAAVKEFQKQDADWITRQFDKRFSGEQQKQQHQQSSEKWTAQLDEGRKQFSDYDSVALSDKLPVSFATMTIIHGLADGALRTYSLGKNAELATKLAELTAMPGENQHKDYPSFMKWVKSDPDRAMLYGEKMAAARAEIAKLAVPKKGTAALPQKPLKEIIRSASRPSAEVDTEESAGPPQDPIARALINMKNGVKGAQKEYNRLRNEQDLRNRRGR